jgi:protein-disulfide isomerase
VDLSGLTEEQKRLALKVLNDTACLCGCGMTVAQCRVEDQSCPQSPILARAIVDAVRRGQDEEGVRAAYNAVAGAVRGTKPPSPPTPASAPPSRPAVEIALEGSPIRGDAAAPVTIVEFSDFQCPYCSGAARTVKRILADYQGKVRLVFKHFPLPFHAQARPAAAAAEAAGEQGKFWEMHDLLFQNPRALQGGKLLEYARQLDLEMAPFQAALSGTAAQERIERDLEEGRRVGVRGTPTFFINGRRLPSYHASAFRQAIDRALAEAGRKEPAAR